MKDIFATDDPYDPAYAGATADKVTVDDWSDDENVDPFEDPNLDFYAFKWVCDGAESMENIIERLRAQIEWFEERKGEGWTLEGPVDNGQVELRRPAADA